MTACTRNAHLRLRLAPRWSAWLLVVGVGGACDDAPPPTAREAPDAVLFGDSPASVLARGGGTSVDLFGHGLTPAGIVHLVDDPVSSSFVSPNHVRVHLTAEDIASARHATFIMRFGEGVLANPTNRVAFAILNPRPVVEAVVPESVPFERASEVRVTGSDFAPGARVRLGDRDFSADWVNAQTLTVDVPAGELGAGRTHAVRVENLGPGGGTSFDNVRIAVQRRPRVLALSPSTVPIGSPDVSVTVHGTGFTSESTVLVGGLPRTTTVLDDERLTFEAQTSELVAEGAIRFVVSNGAEREPSLPGWLVVASGAYAVTDAIVQEVSNHEVVYDPVRDRVYANRQGSGEILAFDAVTGAEVGSVTVPAETQPMAITDDATYLYAGYRSASGIVRIDLETFTVDMEIPITGITQPGAPYTVMRPHDIVTVPGQPRQLVVAVHNTCCSPRSRGLVVFTDSVRTEPGWGAAHLTAMSPDVLYAISGGSYATFRIVDGTLVPDRAGGAGFRGSIATATAGYLVSEYVDLVDPIAFDTPRSAPLNGPVVVAPDPATGRILYKAIDGFALYALHHLTLEELGSVPITPLLWGHRSMVRVGTDGVAIGGGDYVGIIRSTLIGN